MLTYRYLTYQQVLQFDQTVALVGKSGSGKSTIVNLIPRFYECSSGKVLIDDVDIKNFRLNSLRNQVSLVTQQVMLFEGSIAENIAYFSEKTNFAKITEASVIFAKLVFSLK